MKLLNKISICACMAFMVSTNVVASTYVVKSGDMLINITHKLGFHSIKEAGFKVPSGDINKIFPGDIIEYKKKKKKRFVSKKQKIDLKKFCFKDASSIHYRAEERCR